MRKPAIILCILAILFAVGKGVEAAGLADSPWPCFKHDSRHTGLSMYVGAQSNNLKWSRQTDDEIWSSPAIDTDGTIYIGSNDGKIYALNPDSTLKWTFQTGDKVESSPAIDIEGTIYFGSYDSYVYALDPNGNLKWSYQTGDKVLASPSIDVDGTIIIGSEDNIVYAFDPNGSLKWTFEAESSL